MYLIQATLPQPISELSIGDKIFSLPCKCGDYTYITSAKITPTEECVLFLFPLAYLNRTRPKVNKNDKL